MQTPRDHIRQASRNAAKVLDLLMRMAGASDTELGRAVGLTRAMIRLKRTSAGWYLDDAMMFGEAFDIPAELFFRDPNDVARYLVDRGMIRPQIRDVPWAQEVSRGRQEGRRVSTCNPHLPRSEPRFVPVKTPPRPPGRGPSRDPFTDPFLTDPFADS